MFWSLPLLASIATAHAQPCTICPAPATKPAKPGTWCLVEPHHDPEMVVLWCYFS